MGGALTSSWQVGGIPQELQGGGCCTWLFHIKQKYCIHQHTFLCSNIQHSTFHQTNYCSRPQTIRWFRQSDRKSVGLPIRLKELRTFACFPLSQHSGFYFPPFAKANGPPFLSRTGNVLHAFLCYIDRLEVCGWRVDKERFYKKGHRVTSVCFPVFKHRGIHYPTKFADFSPERETFRKLSFCGLQDVYLFIKDYSISPCNPHRIRNDSEQSSQPFGIC